MMDVDWLTAPPEHEEEQDPKRIYGVVTGRVINMIDPNKRASCRAAAIPCRRRDT